jgi:ubiquinone/menaquinone biosynthesis C-methylase UbiE
VGDEAFLKYNTNLFRKVAPYYDGFDLLIGHVRKSFVGFVDPAAGARILDAATGTGRQAFAFASAGHAVMGVDLSPDMLSVASRKRNFPNLTLIHGDAAALPFADGSFDVALMSFALHCMPSNIRLRAVRELKRVTRPDGRVAFVDYRLPSNRLGRRIVYSAVSLYETTYWQEFVRSDFESLLVSEGLRVEKRRYFFLGSMRMLLCAPAS